MNYRGAGEKMRVVIMGYAALGTIGTIGTNFPACSTCVRAREICGCGLQVGEGFQDSLDAYAEKIIPIVPIVPEVLFVKEDQWVERAAFRLSIVPKNQRSSLSSLKNKGQIKMKRSQDFQ